MECEEFLLSDWSPPDNRIQSERAKRANSWIMECEEFILPDWSPPDNPIQSERASSSLMGCEELIFLDWSPPDNPIQSEHASSSIMECEEFILPDWSPSDDPARVLAAEGSRNPSISNSPLYFPINWFWFISVAEDFSGWQRCVAVWIQYHAKTSNNILYHVIIQ